jgi:hypothetical protein
MITRRQNSAAAPIVQYVSTIALQIGRWFNRRTCVQCKKQGIRSTMFNGGEYGWLCDKACDTLYQKYLEYGGSLGNISVAENVGGNPSEHVRHNNPDVHHAACLARWTAPVIAAMSVRAREGGYTLAIRHSMKHDLEVSLVPWCENALAHEDLILHLRDACSSVTGMPTSWLDRKEDHVEGANNETIPLPRGEEYKLHGRGLWNWGLGGGVYVNCSIIPMQKSQQ